MDLIALYGTDKPPRPSRVLRAGDAQVTLDAGQLRHLRMGGIEAIRAVSFLVRDRDWGTVEPHITDLTVNEGRVTYAARYDLGGGSLTAQVALTLRLLGGLTTSELAHAFLVPEPTMGQRLSRANEYRYDTAVHGE